jgi:hypothetical protein
MIELSGNSELDRSGHAEGTNSEESATASCFLSVAPDFTVRSRRLSCGLLASGAAGQFVGKRAHGGTTDPLAKTKRAAHKRPDGLS